jgi:hypothetical protein
VGLNCRISSTRLTAPASQVGLAQGSLEIHRGEAELSLAQKAPTRRRMAPQVLSGLAGARFKGARGRGIVREAGVAPPMGSWGRKRSRSRRTVTSSKSGACRLVGQAGQCGQGMTFVIRHGSLPPKAPTPPRPVRDRLGVGHRPGPAHGLGASALVQRPIGRPRKAIRTEPPP